MSHKSQFILSSSTNFDIEIKPSNLDSDKDDAVYSYADSLNEIEAQVPQMKHIVSSSRTPTSLDRSDTKMSHGNRQRLLTNGDAEEFKSNLFNDFNQFKVREYNSRNKESMVKG